jgi:flagellar basal body P-ring formation protein FlgA
MKLLTIIALCSTLGGNGAGDPPEKPELRLRAATTVRGLHVTIGDLCEIKPTNEQTLALSEIRFGPAPSNGYARMVSKTDIVRALASAGIQLKTVKLTGTTEVSVQSFTTEISTHDILDAATASLQAQLTTEGGDVEFEPPVRIRRMRAPPGRVSQDLRARVRNNKTGMTSALVDVQIMVDGEVFKTVPISYKLQRFHQVLKTTGTIRKNTPLGPENIKLVREPMAQLNDLYLTGMQQVTGMIAARDLKNSQLLRLNDLMPPSIIRRGDIVTVVLTRGRVKVTSRAIANQDAPLNGRIQLTNMNSRSQMTGIVYGPGLVVIKS